MFFSALEIVLQTFYLLLSTPEKSSKIRQSYNIIQVQHLFHQASPKPSYKIVLLRCLQQPRPGSSSLSSHRHILSKPIFYDSKWSSFPSSLLSLPPLLCRLFLCLPPLMFQLKREMIFFHAASPSGVLEKPRDVVDSNGIRMLGFECCWNDDFFWSSVICLHCLWWLSVCLRVLRHNRCYCTVSSEVEVKEIWASWVKESGNNWKRWIIYCYFVLCHFITNWCYFWCVESLLLY